MSVAIRINLLDWRAAEREAKKQRFVAQLVAAAVAAVILFGMVPMFYYDHLIGVQQARNQYLQDQITAADGRLTEIRALKKTREDLVNRMHVIEQLQQSRSAIVHYFDQLTATIPGGVYLTGLVQKDNTTTLDGVAESNARVSEYMTNLDSSPWFSNPRLIVIKRDDSGPRTVADFTLEVDSEDPDAPKEPASALTTAPAGSTATGAGS